MFIEMMKPPVFRIILNKGKIFWFKGKTWKGDLKRKIFI